MAELVIAPATEVVKCIAKPIQRQFNYLYYFNTNIQNLKDEAKRLDDAKEGLQRQVEAAKRNTDDIVPQVDTWLGKVDEIQKDYLEIEPEILNVKSGCLAIKSRFLLSRKATKMTADMKKLHDDGKFGQISTPAPPAAMSLIPFGQVYELKSRKDFEEEVMVTLREKKVSLMGLYGMGGVGKTTMAKKIMTRAREEGLFDEIVIAVVSQPVDKSRIQKELAELLGLNLGVDSLLARAQCLRIRLMNSKSVLIILDDLWKGLDLEELGIPKECTILLTSRNSGVFRAMNVDQTFQVKTLDEVEAWSLFKENVGACADDQSLIPTAQKIVRECKGLPIAIVTVAVALKDEMDKSIWENAVHELRSCNPRDIPDFLEQVYNPLKLSYDLLESPCARSLFLICCLFPEDHDIPISDLCLYAGGLCMFERIGSLQVARNKVQTLIKMLKSRSLLLEGIYERYVKMHDVVRDVGIFIAAQEGLIDPNLNWKSCAREESNDIIDCSWIFLSSADIITLPGGSTFPNLCFLLVDGPRAYQKSHPFWDNLFESTRKLCVLSIKDHGGMRSLPHTLQLQKNMRTLILDGCLSLEDISVVGELVSLEILRCHFCQVKELPVEIGRLNRLKLLDISDCCNLETIKSGVISRLIRLEELTLISSFTDWQLTVEEGKNAAVCELNFLSSLTALKIEIEDASLAAVQIHLPNLVEFNIRFGYIKLRGHGKQLVLMLKRDVIVGDWIHQLLRSTESLLLEGEGSSKLLPLLPQLQNLIILFMDNVKMTRLSDGTTTVFPLLKELQLRDNNDLEEIHKGPISSDSFNTLYHIKILECHSLRSVLPWAMGNNYAISLVITSCSMLEQVLLCNEEESDQSRCITFPKLEKLTLYNLPMLTTLCKGFGSIEFPALTEMVIGDCSNMKSLVSSTKNDHKKCSDDDSQHLFCKPAAFGRLKELTIEGYHGISHLWCDQIPIEFFTELVDLNVFKCDNIKSLFSPSIARNLVNLRKLNIESCCEMVKVIEDKDDNGVERTTVVFGKLVVLKVRDCNNIKSLFSSSIADNLVNLRKLIIENCGEMVKVVEDKEDNEVERSPFINLEKLKLINLPKMEFFLRGSLNSPNSFKDLQSIRIESCLMLEQVILWNEEEGGNDIDRRITFPKLNVLVLRDLPRLTSLCKGIQSIEFPLLKQTSIWNCPNMKN